MNCYVRQENDVSEWQPIETAPRDTMILLRIQWSEVPVVGTWDGRHVSADTEHYETSCGTYCYGGTPSTARHTVGTGWAALPQTAST